MDEQFVSQDKEKNSFPSQSSLQITGKVDLSIEKRGMLSTFEDRRHSTTSSYRTVSPVAFFHDGYVINRTDVQKNVIDIQRRAQAIATAPRRKRYDDDEEDDETKKSIDTVFRPLICMLFV